MKNSRESVFYAKTGASSSKAGIEGALDRSEYNNFFCDLIPDVCGNPDFYSILHADGAGTKAIIAYLCYREKNDPSYFRSLAQDSLVMNIDDLACVNAFDSLILSNTIGRNRRLVCDQAIGEIVKGYKESVELLDKLGVEIKISGGETADLADLVRTLVVDSSIFARVNRQQAMSFSNCQPGDLLVGFSSTGQASFESKPNSGIASNGISLIRHALIGREYLKKYPEIFDNIEPQDFHYQGNEDLFTYNEKLGTSLADALLSPTRPYAPLLKRIYQNFFQQVHGVVHCTGGGQTKIAKFAQGLAFEKDNLFSCPAIFSLVQENLQVPWEEMFTVFNMGHRIELACTPAVAEEIIALSAEYKITAQVIGRVIKQTESTPKLRILSSVGEFEY